MKIVKPFAKKVILLPGGSVDRNEYIENAIKRELYEELCINYEEEELDYFTTLKYFQKNYLKRDGTLTNRLIETAFFQNELLTILMTYKDTFSKQIVNQLKK